MWKIKNNAQAQGTILKKFLEGDFLCVWCNSQTDTITHRYFSYPSLFQFWDIFKKITGWNEEPSTLIRENNNWVIVQFKNKYLDHKRFFRQVAFATFTWILYREFSKNLNEEKFLNMENLGIEAGYAAVMECKRILETGYYKSQNLKIKEKCKQLKFAIH